MARSVPWVGSYAIAVLSSYALLACHADSAPRATEPRDAAIPADASPALTTRENGRPAFCDRQRDDIVRDTFCKGTAPSLRGLSDLQRALHLLPPAWAVDDPVSAMSEPLYGADAARDFVVLGHSTALAGHVVSPINPRLFLLGYSTALAFQRGVQRVELATLARDNATYNFYLVTFTQACNESAAGCSPADLYTPRVEADWTRAEIRDDEDLKDTSFDCRQCHQRGRDTSTLLMREVLGPWTHFIEPLGSGASDPPPPGVRGSDLMLDYLRAKGDEAYGGFAVDHVPASSPEDLELFVGDAQPLLFDAPRIEGERFPYGPAGYPDQPQPSPTWDSAYEAFKRGEQLALPDADMRPVDVDKQAELSAAYTRYRAGEMAADALPDLADIFPDDAYMRAKIGLQTEPDATPVEALIQACGSCHNDVLDQTLSRARFNIDMARMDERELATAIARIELPRSAAGAMPPPEARQLDEGARARLLAYLREAPSSDADPRLARAARLGMLGGGQL